MADASSVPTTVTCDERFACHKGFDNERKDYKMSMLAMVFTFAFSVVSDVCYDDSHQNDCVGDLYLPARVLPSTPMVVVIHGGGWSGMDRSATKGIAEYFAEGLGFAVFNIEYRLASAANRWPACGDDCVAAANFVLSDDFKTSYGFSYDKVWLCGGSAGGHLTLWALVNLDKDKVAGAIAISPIGDPDCDVGGSRSSQETLLGPDMNYASMDPRPLIEAGMAPLLITHATGDAVVPIWSSKRFATAYEEAGNSVDFFEYPDDLEPNEGGHCIWRPASSPHRLIDTLERKIAYFVRNAKPADGLKTARAMQVTSVHRAANGYVNSVELSFGAGNGLANRLYVAYGSSYGGDRMGDWEHFQYVATITDDMTSYEATVPHAEKIKFFLDVPFPDGAMSVPLKAIVGSGQQYIDTELTVAGGDELKCQFSSAVFTAASGGIMGTRTSSDVNDRNVNAVYNYSTLFLDYVGDKTIADNYSNYRIMPTVWNNSKYEITLSAAKREVRNVDNGGISGQSPALCPDQFETPFTVYLFKVSGSPAVSDCGVGQMFGYEHVRNGAYLAAYIPYRVGTDRYGFYDRVSGNFKESETATAFGGVEAPGAMTPLTSATETIVKGEPLSTVEPEARKVVSATPFTDGGVRKLNVALSDSMGVDNRLFLAWGDEDCGSRHDAWDHFESVCVVASAVSSLEITVPPAAKFCRVFLSLPFDGDDFPVPLQFLKGDGSGYIDSGHPVKGGDTLMARVKVVNGAVYSGSILGSRFSASAGNDRNVVAAYNGSIFYLDYTSSNILTHRCTADFNYNWWYDLVLSATNRFVRTSGGTVAGENPAPCTDEFTTAGNCWLFYASGDPAVKTKFNGCISYFSMRNADGYKCSLYPCRMGSVCGFYDRVGCTFLSPNGGEFSGDALEGENPLVSVSGLIKASKGGFVILLR